MDKDPVLSSLSIISTTQSGSRGLEAGWGWLKQGVSPGPDPLPPALPGVQETDALSPSALPKPNGRNHMHLAVFLLDSPPSEARGVGSFYSPSTTHITFGLLGFLLS